MHALVLDGVKKRYGRRHALRGLSFKVPRHSVCGLIGPNGAGKTTCFSILGGLVHPDEGKIDILGRGTHDPAKRRGECTLLPQDAELPPTQTARSFLRHMARLQRIEVDPWVDRVLDEVELADRQLDRMATLSHGMRRRVALAQALLGAPPLILLDEPLNGLDPALAARVRVLLKHYSQKSTLMVSSHSLADLEAICDHLVFIEEGRCVRQGPLSQIVERHRLVRILTRGEFQDLDALRSRFSELEISVDGKWLRVRGRPDMTVEDMNRQILPALLEMGASIVRVVDGESLEHAYLHDVR